MLGTLCTYTIAVAHGLLAFGSLINPAASDESRSSVEVHACATIGAFHIFVAVVMLMAAQTKNIGHRMCLVGIYLITFVPAIFAVQFLYPVDGGLGAVSISTLWVRCALLGSAIGAMAGSPSEKVKAK